MHIFISVGEPSGDLHGANLIREIKRRQPDAHFVGFGGDKMEAAGCRLIYPLCRLAVMGITAVLPRLPVFLSLLSKADRYFRHQKPDAVIVIDNPGFNWWIARRAHFHGIPVFYFVPPQLWAWAGWRVKKMQRYVDHVLCSLPFEEKWYRKRGVAAHFVGHPYFDELHLRRLVREFLRKHRNHQSRIIGLLPGSRTKEVEKNFKSMLRAAAKIHAEHPDTRFLVACYKEAHRKIVLDKIDSHNLPIDVHVGRTPEIIDLAHSCIAVSGSVGLELLFHMKPSLVLYRTNSFLRKASKLFLTAPYISLVNLLAEEELFPEFLVDRCPAKVMAQRISEWLSDPIAYDAMCERLRHLRQRVARPGACARTADYVLRVLGKDEGAAAPILRRDVA